MWPKLGHFNSDLVMWSNILYQSLLQRIVLHWNLHHCCVHCGLSFIQLCFLHFCILMIIQSKSQIMWPKLGCFRSDLIMWSNISNQTLQLFLKPLSRCVFFFFPQWLFSCQGLLKMDGYLFWTCVAPVILTTKCLGTDVGGI